MNKIDLPIKESDLQIANFKSEEVKVPSPILDVINESGKSIKENTLYKNLELISTVKTSKHKIYFNKNGLVKVRVNKNWFIEFFRSLLLINFFLYRIKGFSSNQKKVFVGLDKLILQIKILEVKDEEIKPLQLVLKDVHEKSLEILKAKHKKDPFKKEAYLSLQNKIKNIVFKRIVQPKLELPTVIEKNETKIEPIIIEEKMEDIILPSLPDIEEYNLPLLIIDENKIKEPYQKAQTFYQLRTTALENLNESLESYKKSKIILDGLEEKFSSIEKKPTPIIATQTLGPNFAPPPPLTKFSTTPPSTGGNIPIPPPLPHLIKKEGPKLSWKEKQKNLLQDVTVSNESKLMEEFIAEKINLRNTYNEIFKTLFPALPKVEVGIEELTPYIDKFNNLAKDHVKDLSVEIENLDPRKIHRQKQAARKLKNENKEDEFKGLNEEGIKKVKKLRILTKELASRKQALDKNTIKKQENGIEKNKLINERNKLATELLNLRNNEISEKKEKEYLELSEKINSNLSEEEINKNIENLNKNIEKSINELSKLLEVEKQEAESLITAAEKEIENIFSIAK